MGRGGGRAARGRARVGRAGGPAAPGPGAAGRGRDGAGETPCWGTGGGREPGGARWGAAARGLPPPVPLPRKLTPALLSVPARMLGAVGAAADVLERTRADVLVGFGGYV